MTEVVGVKFKPEGRIYYFDPLGKTYNESDRVIVETSRGIECGTISSSNHEVADETIIKPLKRVVRIATEQDLKRSEDNRRREKEAFPICEQKILEHGLDMKLVDVECSFDNSKLLFYFTSDGRVDFRELVKDLAAHFRTRIELRQIGVRDEAKMLGGLGICGQPFCCSRFLSDFQPVSIKMAKEQGLSLNPTKISGTCGRLMCCLKYEQDAYEYLNKLTPRQGSHVRTSMGEGVVTDEAGFEAKVVERIAQEYKQEADFRFVLDAREYLLNKTNIELPEEFMKKWLFTINEGKFTMEDIEKDFALFCKDFRWQMISQYIMREQKMEITREEVLAVAKQMAKYQFAMYGLNDVPQEQLDSYAEAILANEKEGRRIVEKTEQDKVIGWVKSVVTLDEKEISIEDLQAMNN